MSHLSIRDLQKISGEAISRLPGSVAIKSGDRTVALLTPIKPVNLERLEATLKRAEELAEGRDAAADDAALAQFGDVDPANWTEEAVRALREESSKT